MVKLFRICFRNFRSYGNRWVDLKFNGNGGLNIIYGSNASGKTSIKYAIDYVLFGKIRNMLTDVVNRVNKRDCEAFLFLKNKDKYYVIMRGHQPQYLGMVELENEEDVYIDNLSELKKKMVKCTQKDIDNLLNINSNLYTNCLSVSISNFKSYINLTLDEKRKIIDKLFNIDRLNELNLYYKEVMKKINSNKLKLEENIKILGSEVNEYNNMKTTLLNNDDKLNVDREDLEKKLNFYKNKYEEITNKLLKQSESLYQELNKELYNLSSEKSKYESHIRTLIGKLSILSGERCPTCNSSLNNKDVETLKNKIKQEREENERKLRSIKSKIEELNIDIKKLEGMIKGFYHQKEELSNKIYEINNYVKMIYEKENISKKIDYEIEERMKKLESLKLELENLEKEENFYRKVLQVLDDTGLKKYVLSKISVMLNKIVEIYRNKLEMKYKVVIDPDFSVSLYYLGDKIDYHILSSGEIRKIDILLIICILHYLKMVYPDLNLVFFDEIFSSLDESNVNIMLNVLNEFSMEKGINFYLISPDYIDYDKYNDVIYVKKENGFSNIEYINR